MKGILLNIFLFLLTLSSEGQNTVLCRINPKDSKVVQVKWYCATIINTLGFNIYRKETGSAFWEKLNSKPVLFKSYKISDEEFNQDKELKGYLDVASRAENIKDLALLAVLIKSFKSDAFSNYLGIRYDDLTATVGKDYHYKVTALNSTGEKELAISRNLKIENYKSIPPPQNIATKNGNKRVSFKWMPEPDSYFGVHIYRKTNDTGAFRRITKDPIILSKTKNKKNEEVYGEEFYVDGKLKPHTNYVYQLEAIDFFGSPSLPSKSILVSLKDLDPPKSPDSVYNSLEGKKVTVKWKKKIKEEDLLGFNIYRTTKNDTDFIKLNKVPVSFKDSLFMDQAPHFGSYMYAVSCIDKDSNERISNSFHVEVYDNEPPKKPENLTIQADSGHLILSWTKNKEDDVKGYLVYRTINKNLEDTYVKVTPDPVSVTTYTDVLAKIIKNKFLYKVVAVDKSLNRSPYSEFAIARMPDFTAPNAPFIKTIFQNERKQIVIEWLSNVEPDLAGYSIYRKYLNDSSSSFKKLNTKALDRIVFRYTDRTVEESGTYEYYLVAIDSSENASKNSNHLKFKFKITEDDNIVSISDFKARYNTRQKQVILKWKLKNESVIKGVVLYKMKLGEESLVPLSGLIEETSRSDNDIQKGENYIYQLRVYDQKGDVYKSEKIILTIK